MLRGKEVELLMEIPKHRLRYMNKIGHGKATYSYAVMIFNSLEKKGLIATERVGRTRVVHLTDKGKEIINLYEQIHLLLNSSN